MTDPMDALVHLQSALDKGVVRLRRGELHGDIGVIADAPIGNTRFTYADVQSNRVQAIVLFALTEPVDGIPCFGVGYAVIESERGRGLATELLAKGIDELRNGLTRNGIDTFYLEAIVSRANLPSQRLARRLLSDSPVYCTDACSGEPAIQYLRKIE